MTKRISKKSDVSGFTLIEIMIYAVIFGISSFFLVNILTTVTRTQLRQTAVNEVNSQISFVGTTVQRLVRQSSLIENDAGTTSTTLVLRMASSSLDRTFVYSSGTTIYLEEGSAGIGQGTAIPLTNERVNATNFSVTKYENAGGLAVVQVDLVLDNSATNPQAHFTRVWRSAIGRVTAATFDSAILPNTGSSFDIGGATKQWKDAYFSGGIGIGTAPISAASIKATEDIQLADTTKGLVLVKPNGTDCVRFTVNASGNIATSSAFACP